MKTDSKFQKAVEEIRFQACRNQTCCEMLGDVASAETRWNKKLVWLPCPWRVLPFTETAENSPRSQAGFSVAVRWPSVGHAAAYVIEFKEARFPSLCIWNHVDICGHMWTMDFPILCSLLAYGIFCRLEVWHSRVHWFQAGSTQTERFVRAAAPTTPGTLVELRAGTPSKGSCTKLHQVTCKAEKENTCYFEEITHTTPVLFKF